MGFARVLPVILFVVTGCMQPAVPPIVAVARRLCR